MFLPGCQLGTSCLKFHDQYFIVLKLDPVNRPAEEFEFLRIPSQLIEFLRERGELFSDQPTIHPGAVEFPGGIAQFPTARPPEFAIQP
jgi:hypothetical protein